MPIIANMKVFGYGKDGETILEPTETCFCPKCKRGVLITRAHVKRHCRKEETGEKEWFQIPVGKCNKCTRTCRILPDHMVPNKHYEQQVIAKALDGKYPGKTVYLPCARTIRRWAVWLVTNKKRIDGQFRSVGYRTLDFSEELLFSTASLLEKLRQDTSHWLQITTRFIYNSGCRLEPA